MAQEYVFQMQKCLRCNAEFSNCTDGRQLCYECNPRNVRCGGCERPMEFAQLAEEWLALRRGGKRSGATMRRLGVAPYLLASLALAITGLRLLVRQTWFLLCLAVLFIAAVVTIPLWRSFLLVSAGCMVLAAVLRLALDVRGTRSVVGSPEDPDDDDPDEDEVEEEPLPPPTENKGANANLFN